MYSWGNDTATTWGGGGFDYGSARASYASSRTYEDTEEKMGKAYKLSSIVLDMAMSASDKKLIEQLGKEGVVITPGSYDSVEKVLGAAKTPYKLLHSGYELSPSQVLLVNCPGDSAGELIRYKQAKGTDAIRKFVSDGGFLVTTDWALERILEEAFPGFVKRAGKDTGDDVVEVDLVANGSPYTRGLGNGSLKPLWWLEGSSYPIGIEDRNKVDVLLGSKEMKKKYGESPVAVKFPYENGRVIHATSHFFLQSVKAKYEAQAKKPASEFVRTFVGLPKKSIATLPGIDSVSFGAIESAYTSLRFLHNIFIEKMKRNLPRKSRVLGA